MQLVCNSNENNRIIFHGNAIFSLSLTAFAVAFIECDDRSMTECAQMPSQINKSSEFRLFAGNAALFSIDISLQQSPNVTLRDEIKLQLN